MIVEIIGWIAAAFTLGAYSMKTMLPLRLLAVFANFFFLTYGYLTEIYPTFFLHTVLLPFNGYRLWELLRLNKKVRAARYEEQDLSWIKDFAPRSKIAAGSTLFKLGDAADYFYYVEGGEILLEEIDVQIKAGDVFGEVAFFSKSGQRTLSARALTDCVLYKVDEATLMRLYFQNPVFGFFIVQLLVSRLMEDISHAAEGAKIHTS